MDRKIILNIDQLEISYLNNLIYVEVFNNVDFNNIDYYLVEYYPELIHLGFCETEPGRLNYTGNLSIMEVTNLLTKLGFKVFKGKGDRVSKINKLIEESVLAENYEEASRLKNILEQKTP